MSKTYKITATADANTVAIIDRTTGTALGTITRKSWARIEVSYRAYDATGAEIAFRGETRTNAADALAARMV